jgi:exopolysaccharide production protein ExoZ
MIRIQSLQALRFIAAAGVVVNHALQQAESLAGVPAYTDIGAAGVDVFFVLSGFLITLTGPLATNRPAGAKFFWRRWSRVAPLFYVLSFPGILMLGEGLDWPRTIATFLFWPAAGKHLVQPYIGVGWTLCFEMMFYSAVSLFLVGGQMRRNALIGAVVLSVAWFFRGRIIWAPEAMLANPIYLEFAAGVALALVWPRLRSLPTWLGAILVAIGIAGVCTTAILGTVEIARLLDAQSTLADEIAFRRVGWFGFPAALIVAGALILERSIASWPLTKALAWLGDASYSIYLAHSLTMLALWNLAWKPLHPSAWITIPVGICVGLGAGVLLHMKVEKPLIELFRRLPEYARGQIGRPKGPGAGDLRPVVDDLVG